MPLLDRLCRTLVTLAAGWMLGASPVAAQTSKAAAAADDIHATTVEYVATFYPLWFTWYQSQYASTNRLVGPDRISSVYQIVVAINDDTLYASTFIDLSVEPVILTIPSTEATYSMLNLDPYGNIFKTTIPEQTPGTYALVGPNYTGAIPENVTAVSMPLDHSVLIFRADKHASSGENQQADAEMFRRGLQTVSQCVYTGATCPSGVHEGGKTLILPEVFFGVPFKTMADTLVAVSPIAFLRQLQTAVAAPHTPPMSSYDQALSARFDALFGSGEFSLRDAARRAAFASGAHDAHALILDRYLGNRGPTQWIHFSNIGQWGDAVLDRAAITEFIQYGNGPKTAAYFHTFRDGAGRPLSGLTGRGYTLRFERDQVPDAKRFWSLTAYTPESIELPRNSANKYVVASYTPGLVTNRDGSITIWIAPSPPPGAPVANWLPMPERAFNVMLRVYGPEGNVAEGNYVPPAIMPLR